MKKLTNYVWIAVLLFFAQQSKAQSYLKFSGTNAYVTFGNNSQLGLSAFTIECWFQRQGTGVTTSTGTGGVTAAIPLITKGRGEADGSNVDCNYFFGINTNGNVLAADFEEGSSGSTPGLNHPVSGVTQIQNNVWYHGAVTYDGNTWKLYLNGKLEASLAVNQPCQNQSIQHSAIASAQTSTGTPQGYFNGAIDEARIWNFAKTQAQIKAVINSRLFGGQSGMMARWALDEGSGTTVRDSSGNAINGNIIGSAYSWQTGTAPFNINFPPDITVITTSSTCQKDSTKLSIVINDPEKDTITVKIYARTKIKAPAKFTFIGIPDTQFYTETSNGGNNEMFKTQTRWIVAQKNILNIKHVCQLGDCVQNGDNGGNDIEWKRADTSMQILEDSFTTNLKDGIPYTMNVGNHDQSPGGDAKGTTQFFNQYFGVNRFSGRNYWGGNYRTNNDNNYQLFSANGLDFISISLEYDTNADTNVLKWADSILKVHSNRKGIIISHWIINADGSFGAQGAAIYNKLKVNPNLMLMLCGHINPNGEASRYDVYNGITVATLLSDYQDRTKGGNGWLRIMTLDPDKNAMDVKTYSPTLKQYETDANSQFTVNNLNLFGGAPFSLISSQFLIGGNDTVNYTWKNLLKDTTYEWYAEVLDKSGKSLTTNYTIATYVPSVNLGNDTAVCNGLTLNAKNAGNKFLWNNAKTTATIFVNTSGKYSVRVTNPNTMCIATDTISLTIHKDPVVKLGNDTAVCGFAYLNANNIGNKVLWSTNDTTQLLKVITTADYNIKVTDPQTGCFAMDTIQMTVNIIPTVNLGRDSSTCGLPVQLDAENAGSTFLWSDNSTSQTFTVTQTGDYTVTVKSAQGCEKSDTIKINVKQVPLPPAVTGKTSYCDGDTVMALTASGVNIVWYEDSLKTKIAGTGNSIIPKISAGKSFYTEQSVDACISGLTRTDIIFNPLPIVKLTIAKSEFFVTDTAEPLNGTPNGGLYKGKGVAGNRFFPANAGVGGPYRISYAFTTPDGCTDSASTSVTVTNKPTGIQSLEGEVALIVYPNPADVNIIHFNKTVSGQLLDLVGKTLATFSDAMHLDITWMQSGIYFLQADTGETLKLVINK